MESAAETAASARGARRPAAEDIAWLGLIPAALILLLALRWLAPPLSDLYPNPDYPFYPEVRLNKIHPEPLEATRFLLAAAVPLLLAAAVLLFGSGSARRLSLDPAIVAIQAAGIAFLAWMAIAQGNVNSLQFFGAFDRYLLPAANLAAAPVIGLALTLAAIGWEGPHLTWARRLRGRLEGGTWVALAIAVILTGLWLLPGVIPDTGLSQNGLIPPGHVPSEFDEFVAASNGRTPLVDYVPWYSALLPILLSPVWQLFDYSITSFTAVMSALSLLGLVAVYGAFTEVTRRAWTALALYVPFMAFALQPWSTDGSVREFNGIYYPTMPQRYLGPFLVIWLCARYLRRGSPPVWALFFAAGLTILNNAEFGAPCLLALIVALAAGADREVPFGRWARAQLGPAAAGLLAALALVCAVILVRTGELPDLGLLGYVARLAGRGFSLAPLPDQWGLHWALYLTFAGALLTAAVRYVNRAPDRTLTGMLAFAAVLGFATGSYFAGRSLPWQLWGLFPIWGLNLALLAWTAWGALRSRSGERNSLRRLALAAFAALAGFGLMVASLDRFPLPWQQLDRITASGPPALYDHPDEQTFIESGTEPGEKVLILGWELEHRLAERAGVTNVSPWFGTLSLLSPKETNRAIDQLEEEGGRKVFVLFVQFFADRSLGRRINANLRRRAYRRVVTDPLRGTAEWQRPR